MSHLHINVIPVFCGNETRCLVYYSFGYESLKIYGGVLQILAKNSTITKLLSNIDEFIMQELRMVDTKKENDKEAAEVQETQSDNSQETINKEEVEAQNAPDAAVETKAADVEEKKTKKKDDESPAVRSIGVGDLDYLSEVRTDLPELKPGDVIRVFYRVVEGGKERIQVFEGTVIARKNKGISKTITVRKTSFGIAVERIFPLNSKLVQKIDVKKHSRVRRAKLYYLRELKGKAARLKELR